METQSRNSFQTALTVEPEKVAFRDIEVGVSYRQQIVIRNVTAHARRIRFVAPGVKSGQARNDSKFRLIYDNKLAISPGLAITVEVEFCSIVEPGDYVDRLLVVSDDFRFEVPLQATMPCAILDFTRFLNFGNVIVQKKFAEELTIYNTGSRPGGFEFPDAIRSENFALEYQPSSGEVPARGSTTVNLELTCYDTPHTVHELLDVNLKNQSSLVANKKSLDIHGTILRQNLHAIYDAQEIKELGFGHAYFGTTVVKTIQLLNDGPEPLSFIAYVQNQRNEDGNATNLEPISDSQTIKNSYVISPSNGTVPEFGSLPVTITFQPPPYEETKGFVCTRRPQDKLFDFGVQFFIESEELREDQTVELQLRSKALVPALKATPEALQFGLCDTNDRRDVVVKLENTHDVLPVDFDIPIVPNYRCTPSKGQLLPRQVINITVSFLPKQLGVFQQQLEVKYCKNLYTVVLYLIGESVKMGYKQKQVKGLEKVAADFEPQYHYVNVEELFTTAPPFKRQMSTLTAIMKADVQSLEATHALENLMADQPEPTMHTLAPSAMQEFVKNKQIYNQYLKDARKKRKVEEYWEKQGGRPTKDFDIFFEDDADIGIKAGSGLKSPKYSVHDVKSEKLWLARPLDDDPDVVRGVTGLRYTHDENKPIRKKFKTAPTTQAEVRDCTAQLLDAQLSLISCGPKKIDFGKVFVKSSISKSFSIFNDLPHSVLLALQLDGIDVLSKTTPLSQVVPSAHACGFDIVMSSPTPKILDKTITYTINGFHQQKLQLCGEVTPVTLLLPTAELVFNFGDDLDRTLTETIVLENPGNAMARFHWQVQPGSAFTVSPEKGTVKPYANIAVSISYTPFPNSTNAETSLTLKIEDGLDQAITCSGSCQEGFAVFSQKKVDFGVLSVGSTAEKTATLKNEGGTNAVFFVESQLEGVTIQPQRGSVPIGSTAEITISVTLEQPQVLDSVVNVLIRGGKTIRLPISAQAVVPNIELEEAEFEFGSLTLGAVHTLPMTLRNSSAVEGTLYINLQDYPEFTLTAVDDSDPAMAVYFERLTYDQYLTMVGGGEKKDSKGGKGKGGKSDVFGMSGGGSNALKAQLVEEDDDDDEDSQIFKLVVPANGTLALQLTYQPTDLGQHFFDLPIVAAGNAKAPGCQRVVHGKALRPRMLFSTTTFDFKTKVVPTGMQGQASVLELHVHNADDFPLLWRIDTAGMSDVFVIDPVSGLLPPEEDQVIKCSFLPIKPVPYQAQLPVYISPPRQEGSRADVTQPLPIEDDALPYLELRLRGQGSVPKLTFDQRMIQLPTVPLGVTAKATFNILNDGYESMDAEYRLPAEYAKIPLQVRFPEGQQLTLSRTKLPVEVEFCSTKSLSFTAKLEFVDADNRSYVIPISGTADNCVLSTSQYLMENTADYALEGEQIVTLKTSSPCTPTHDSKAYQEGADSLVRWLNGVAFKVPIENFPQDLILQQGKPVFEMIEFFSGKNALTTALKERPQGHAPEKADTGKAVPKDLVKINSTIAVYEKALNFCKQHGCLLSMVRPETLLSQDLFVRYVQLTASKSSGGPVSKRQLEKNYVGQSLESWTNFVLQVVKVFLLNRVTPKSFRKDLPGMMPEDDDDDPGATKKIPIELQTCLDVRGMADSNVYGVSESILLRWLNYHFWKINNVERRFPARVVNNFDTDLQDMCVFGMVLWSHAPHIGDSLRAMKYPCTTALQLQTNANCVLQGLRELQLQYPLTTQDIMQDPNPRDFLLLSLFLFQNLPHYVPKSTILYQTLLGTNQTKNIELTNPSKRVVTYTGTLRGSGDFVALQKEPLRIEPKQSCNFPVQFVSKFTRSSEAQLTFTSRREGNQHAAAITFKLQSKCTGKKPRKVIHQTAVVYEVGQEDIEIENPYGEDADFKISAQPFQMVTEFAHASAPPGSAVTTAFGEGNELMNKAASSLQHPIDPFHLSQNHVKIKGNGSAKISVSFLPFEVGHFVTQLQFYDSKAGEFYIELQGSSSTPAPLEQFKVAMKVEEVGLKDIVIPFRNPQMDKARQWLEAKLVREGKTQAAVLQVLKPLPDKAVYDIQLSSPYYKFASKDLTTYAKPANEAEMAASGKLQLEFRPKEPGVYPCSITLHSNLDTRIYQIEGTGTAPNTKCAMTFHSHARQEVIQEIPIVNPTPNDWPLKAIFTYPPTETGERFFSGPNAITASKRGASGTATTTYYELKFKPSWVCEQVCHLALVNEGANETYEYELTGTADEPLAEDHVIIMCQARERTDHEFMVRNHSNRETTFEVESDILHISGPSHVRAAPGETVGYNLSFLPLQAGNVTGCIMFRDSNSGQFSWFTVEVQTSPSKAQQSLSLSCVVRQAIAVDIQLVNPLDDVIVFDVTLVGDGLLGEPEFVLAPKETATYELVFSPFLPAKKKGQAIFVSERVGEFWYDLELIAEQAPPMQLPMFECELGQHASTEVIIENPTGQEVTLRAKSTNKINFKVMQSAVFLQPFGQTPVEIRYFPSSIEIVEEATITLENPAVGSWVYVMQGKGHAPRDAKEVISVSQVQRPATTTITFKNPFLEAVQALVVLETQAPKNVFSLLNKKARLPVAPLGSCQIPVQFNPSNMDEQTAKVIVSVLPGGAGGKMSSLSASSATGSLDAGNMMSWTYLIRGIAEAPVSSTVHNFKCQARETVDQIYGFNLIGLELGPDDNPLDLLRCELEVGSQQIEPLVNRCFQIEIAEPADENAEGENGKPRSSQTDRSAASLTKSATSSYGAPNADKDSQGALVNMRVLFAPLRPFNTSAFLLFSKLKGGGRWRFNLNLTSLEPAVDDIIEIESPLNKPASVAFKLCNHTASYAEFDAFFDSDAAAEFTVSPTQGVLEPAGNPQGTTFVVSYRPTEYGKQVQGRLIIQTEDVMWSYMVKGLHPKYIAPVVDKPRVSTRLSRDLASQLGHRNEKKKNFIKTNISATKSLAQAGMK
ncbi:unnamed protein product [Amoebophrya sp. A120]|nr:unnamed protein product [Amoebophrya sp. A120]|eukprot:GSA120T00022707001.1